MIFAYIWQKSQKAAQRPSLWKPKIVHHRFKCRIWAALCVVASICASPVVALEGRFVGVTTLGTCTVKGRMIPASWEGSTVVFVTPGDYAAGSYVYKDGVGVPLTSAIYTALNATILSDCLGGGAVTNYIPDDTVLGATPASDAYMGFSFDHAGTHYEYALVGATNTRWFANATPLDTTAPTVSISVADTTLYASETSLVTFSFTEPVTGFDNTDVAIANGTLSSVTSSDGGTTFAATFTPTAATADTANVITVNMTGVMDLAQNTGVGSTDSNSFVVNTCTPATEFAAQSDTILQTITGTASRGLTNALSANQAMVQDAKERFVSGADQDVPLNVDGSLEANAVSLSTMGTFFGQSTQGNGTRQLIFGRFDVQRDDESGASTATFSGKIAWERSVSDTTLLGYFISAELGRSNIAGAYDGD
jgi:hypothetical protein